MIPRTSTPSDKKGYLPKRVKPLKRSKPMKRSKLRKQSKQPISKLQRALWVYCKAITRAKYGNECYTCPKKNLEGSNWHTGHFLPKASCGALLKYDLRNLRPQCYNCNLNLGGNGAEFMRKMIIREGQEYVDQLFAERTSAPIKAYAHYELLIAQYQLILEDLDAQSNR